MKKTYAFYCDESGMFTDRDTHIICPLIIRDNMLTDREILTFWKDVLFRKPWQEFHAVDASDRQVQHIVKEALQKWLSREGVDFAYVYHFSKQSYGFDFYPAMLLDLIKWRCRIITNEVIHALEPQAEESDPPTHYVRIKLHLAERRRLNNLYLDKMLNKTAREVVRKEARQGRIAPGRITFDCTTYVEPAKANPFIQVSDALCYLVRAYLNDAPLKLQVKQLVGRLSSQKLEGTDIENDYAKNFCKDIVQVMIIRDSFPAHKAKEAEPIGPSGAAKFDRPHLISQPVPAEALLEKIHSDAQKGRTTKLERLGKYTDAINQGPRILQLAQFDFLYETARALIREDRKYELGATIVEILYNLLNRLNHAGETSDEKLVEIELKTADLYLIVNNHRGNHLSADPRITRALKIAKTLQTDPALWKDVCSVHTHLAVAYQNVFRFDDATRVLFDRVQYLQEQLKNPFIGGNLKAYAIGALLGTYAQSLAFSAHCRFFKEGHAAIKMLEDAELHSLLAAEHFEKDKDDEQQITYQAHIKMQQYILAGQKNALEEAKALIESDGKNDIAVETFLDLFPHRKALNQVYRLHALLKRAYLAGDTPKWLAKIVPMLLKARGQIPAEHPMEQILPYAIMLWPHADTRHTLQIIFETLCFPANIVETIKTVFLAQIEFTLHGNVNPQTIRAIEASITADIRPQWEAYGLNRVLESYLKPDKIDRWHVGPMEVLPFNYC